MGNLSSVAPSANIASTNRARVPQNGKPFSPTHYHMMKFSWGRCARNSSWNSSGMPNATPKRKSPTASSWNFIGIIPFTSAWKCGSFNCWTKIGCSSSGLPKTSSRARHPTRPITPNSSRFSTLPSADFTECTITGRGTCCDCLSAFSRSFGMPLRSIRTLSVTRFTRMPRTNAWSGSAWRQSTVSMVFCLLLLNFIDFLKIRFIVCVSNNCDLQCRNSDSEHIWCWVFFYSYSGSRKFARS